MMRLLVPVMLATLSTASLDAQPDTVPRDVHREIRAMRVETPPVIDGRLDDEAWRQAPSSGNLVQFVPDEGAAPTESTEFRVVYDDDALHVAVWCSDRNPDKILSREMARDGRLTRDDHIVLVLDTFLDRRNGFMFSVNPGGARGDALITDNSSTNENWDGIWSARTTIDDEGWKAEMSIPFKTLSFRPGSTTWGINLERRIMRRNERDRWMGARPEVRIWNVSDAGTLTGLHGVTQGIGVDVVPYFLGQYRQDRVDNGNDADFAAGGDVRWHITPSLAASASYNTDFVQTEVDARQINLDRFPLFFPEKRDFFLQDSGIFNFGSAGSSLIPFFSRRIGLDNDGEIVPILAASKLTGRAGDYSVGVLDAVVDQNGDLPAQNALVARVKRNVFKQSNVGIIGTYGDPNSENENALVGTDYTYRTSKIFGNEILETSVFGLGTYSENVDRDLAGSYGASVSLPNDLYRARVEMLEIGEDFNPALGFAPRQKIRQYSSQLGYSPRPATISSIRKVRFFYGNNHVASLDNDLETASHYFFPIYIDFENGEEVWFGVRRVFEAPEEDFEISDGVTIPAEEFWWTDYRIGVETASKYPVNGLVMAKFGEFFDGTKETYQGQINVLSSQYFGIDGSYEVHQVRLAGGDFDTQLASLRLRISFTPDLTWDNFAQWDDDSDSVGFNGRIRWEFRPGNNLFLVLNQSYNDRMRMLQQQTTVKLALTIRF